MPTCDECGTPIVAGKPGSAPSRTRHVGRPAKYCSNACRQRAFRLRAAADQATELDHPASSRRQPLDSLVGRERDLRHLQTLLRSTRLLTLVGPGGVGKTRLAAELVRRVQRGRDHYARLVELDALKNGDLLFQGVARALGVESGRRDWVALADTIGDRNILLVLDNCEHLLESCAPPVESLLSRCPKLRILATSRQALHVPGEAVFQVGTLSLPEPGADLGTAVVLYSDAVRLFLDRAHACEPAFDLTPDNAGTAAEICRRLDGLPLAIELAARRVGAISLGEILVGLDNQHELLTEGCRTGPPRHRELRATFEWSYQLLNTEEQAVFRRLSVLDGGFDLVGATAVCGGGAVEPCAVPGLVAALEAKSLAIRLPGDTGTPRFKQLHLIRAYGGDRLAASGDLEITRSRAAAWLAGIADALTGMVCPTNTLLRQLRREQENLVPAVDFTATQDDDRHVLLAVALAKVWEEQDRTTAGGHLLAEVLNWVPESRYRGDALAAAAGIAARRQELTEALRLAEDAVRFHRARGDPVGLAKALDALAFAWLCRGENAQAITTLRECLDVVHRVGQELGIALVKHNLAWLSLQVGAVDEAEHLLAENLPTYRDMDTPPRMRAAALHTAGAIKLARSDYAIAGAYFVEGLHQVPLDSMDGAPLLDGLAIVAVEDGDDPRALSLAAAAEAARLRLGVVATPQWRRQLGKALARAESRLVPHLAREAVAAGARLRGPLLRSYALKQGDRRPDDISRSPGQERPLTGREFETAVLVSEGATNREIADQLHLSVSTIKARVSRILDKLNLGSRTQLAAWAASSLDNTPQAESELS